MEEPLRHLRPPELVEDPHRGDAQAVGEDGEGDGGKDEHELFPERGPVVVGQEQAHEEQGDHEAEPAAGIHHLELGEPQVDHVPFPKGGETVRLDHGHPDLRGDQLQPEGERAIDGIGGDEHGQAEEQGEGDAPELPPPEVEPAEADGDEPEGEVERGVLGRQLPDEEEADAEADGDEPLPGGEGWQCGELLPLFPDQVEDDEGDHPAVGEIIFLPLAEEIGKG